ncbi:hypothetical protein Hanom_Chr03g00179081 [Helianthus anomalus]
MKVLYIFNRMRINRKTFTSFKLTLSGRLDCIIDHLDITANYRIPKTDIHSRAFCLSRQPISRSPLSGAFFVLQLFQRKREQSSEVNPVFS